MSYQIPPIDSRSSNADIGVPFLHHFSRGVFSRPAFSYVLKLSTETILEASVIPFTGATLAPGLNGHAEFRRPCGVIAKIKE